MSDLFKKIKKRFHNILKPHPHQRIDNLSTSVKSSFTNLRKDMEHISKLLHHYDGTMGEHNKRFEQLAKRLLILENKLNQMQRVDPEKESEVHEEPLQQEEMMEDEVINDSLWESLTETQQKLCWKLAALQKEMPDQWISLKYLAQELYPDKDYNLVRSTLSQFIAGLEELGILKRKRKGKQAYVFSTEKNPCHKKKMPLTIESIEKKKTKKKKEK